MSITIRRAQPNEADLLSGLARSSKRAWGYDAGFLAAVEPELAVSADDIERNACYVAEQDGKVVGFYLIVDDNLERFFVSPDEMRQGIGRTLFEHATTQLKSQTLRIVSDPHAAAFYERMGARYIGQEASALVQGRHLPVFEYRRNSQYLGAGG